MGLSQVRTHHIAAPWTAPADWLVPGVVLLAAVLIAGFDADSLLRYERTAIGRGEAWRFVSGHFAHLGTPHLAMNAAGLVLVWLLVGHSAAWWQWLLVLSATIAGIDAAFWWFEPQLEWYVGLSGVLHGLLVFGLLCSWETGKLENTLLLIALVAKLGYEQLAGPLPGSAETAQGPVVVNAHLYGAIAGACCAAAAWIRANSSRTI